MITCILCRYGQPVLAVMMVSLLASLLPGPTEAKLVDRVVAEVNGSVITLSEVEAEGKTLFDKIQAEAPEGERDTALAAAREQVLNSLIDQTLIAQEAEKKGITVTEEELDAAFEQVLRMSQTSRAVFLEQLDKSGLDEPTYRRNLRSQLYQNKLVSRDIRSRIVITDEMMLDFYENNYTSRVSEGGFYLLQIGISWGQSEAAQASAPALYEDKLAAQNRAERVHKLARSGGDFRELARKFSDLPSAADGGDIGVFQLDEMAEDMRGAVADLRPGEVSSIIETQAGFQFFKLLSTKDGGIVQQTPYEAVKDDIRETLFRQAMETEYQEWLSNMRENAYIRVLPN